MDNLHLVGVGLRPHHYPNWHECTELPILEVLADNYLFLDGGPALGHLDRLAERTPLVMHSVGLNLCGTSPFDDDYVREIQRLRDRIRPRVVSDHFCFSRSHAHSTFDLLPVPRTYANLMQIAAKVERFQDLLGQEVALENTSTYVEYRFNEMTEMEFLRELCDRSGCKVVLDINNAYVSGVNHGHDPWEELSRLKTHTVAQFHLAGHTAADQCLIDTHAELIGEPVWDLYQRALKLFLPETPVIIERDDDAEFELLMAERDRAIEHRAATLDWQLAVARCRGGTGFNA